MKKQSVFHYSLIALLLSFSNLSYAQHEHSPSETCGFDHVLQKKKQDPNFLKQWEEHNQMMALKQNGPKPKSGTIYKIPVVVHVLHLGEAVGSGSNISDAQIQSAIDNLNDVYRKVLTSQVSSESVDMEVEFELAKRDPNCNATNGIVRVNASSVSGYTQYGVKLDGTVGADENTLKDLSKWPTDQYMNFWIVTEIDDNDCGAGVQGYANLPMGIDAYNGAVMMSCIFGYNPGAGMDNSTVIHEVGHFLDLYHPFEGGDTGICPPAENATNCATQGDFVCDTPPIMNYLGYNGNTIYFNCPNGTSNPCSTGNLDQVMHNFMNYTSCPDRFTAGQKDRVTAALQTTRASLTTSLGLTPPNGAFTPPIAACASITTGQGLTGGYAGITEMQFSNLTKVSSSTDIDNPTNGYMDFTTSCLYVANVQINQTYPLKVTTWFNTQKVKAWIDYNNDGDFNDTGEELTPSGGLTSTGGAQVTQNVTIPATATLNTYLRMRVISDMNSVSGPCHTSTYGQTEDYAVYITGNVTLDCDFSASTTSACTNSPVTFTSSNISGTATSWTWTITPSTGVTYAGGTSSTSQNPQISFANAGTYTVEMLAGDGTNTETTTKTNYITVNAAPTTTESVTNPTCGTNGSVIYTPSGGTGTYTLTFNSTVQAGLTVNNLGAGTYSYSIADGNNCTVTGSTVLTSSGGPTATVSGTDASCGQSNGSATVTVSGNTGAPTLTWSSGGTGLTESNLAVGTYTVDVVVDGCTFNLSQTISNSGGPQLTVSSTDASCGNPGSATATVTGNTGTPVYVWSSGGSAATENNLAAGTYTVDVTVDGCSLSDQVVITSNAPTISITTTEPSCGQTNGSASVTVNGNSGTPTYSWDNGGNTATISNLGAGTYTVTVTVDGCTLTDSGTLTGGASPTVSLNSTQPSCGNDNGSITAIVTGNTGTPTYSWDNGGNTATISNLSDGSYTVTINVDGCTLTDTEVLTSSSPALTLTATEPTCGGADGSVTATVTGNTGTPTYLWSNNQTTASISGLSPGTYTLVVTVDGCTLNADTVLQNTASEAGMLQSSQWVCLNSELTLNLVGNVGNVVDWYVALGSSSTFNPIGFTGTSYTFTVTDPIMRFYAVVQNGNCPSDQSNTVLINTFTQPTVDLPVNIEVISNQNFPVSATVTNGTYSWSPPQYFADPTAASTTINVDETMWVYLTNTDDNGCMSIDSMAVLVIDSLIKDLKIPTGFSPNGDGVNELLEFFNITGMEEFNFVLFDRWGEVVYTTLTATDKWNGLYKGEKVINGIYTYQVTYKYLDGTGGKKAGYIEIIN